MELEWFAYQFSAEPQCANQARASDPVTAARACRIASSSASRVRALAARKKVLIFDQHLSTGFMSGE